MAVNPEYAAFLAQSIEELRVKTAAQDRAWQIEQANWNVDQAAGKIEFTTPDGVTVTGSVQIVGTYETGDGTWLWGWDHPNVVPALQEHARRVRAYGEEHGFKFLTTQMLKISEGAAWEFTALACKLANAQGAYRGPLGSTLIFMTFNDISLGQSKGGYI